ncbi:MAG: sulfotransferase domain-containing protein [Cyanobacteria bacterium P01_H01_bin.105]
MKSIDKFIFNLNQPSYRLYNKARRKIRRFYESDLQKHYRERREAEYLLISPTNCGRTWLRIMLGRILQNAYGIEDVNLHYLYSFSELNPNLPAIKAIHEKFGQFGTYKSQKIIFLVRDPRDALVSRYHQHRNLYPDYEKYDNVDDFMRNSTELSTYIEDYNTWIRHRHQAMDFMLVRYEDLKAKTFSEIERILSFLNLKIEASDIKDAIEYSSFKNMRSIEIKGSSEVRAGVLQQPVYDGSKTQINENSLKVRKGKVGGYREELSSETVNQIDTLVQQTLDFSYGYMPI